jgi:hypothetical protein
MADQHKEETMSSKSELELLLLQLDELMSRTRRPDAIDAVLNAAPRSTASASLREHEVVRKFRQEVESGLIRLDTANQLLGLVRSVLDSAVMP